MTCWDANPGYCDCGRVYERFCREKSTTTVEWMPGWRRSSHLLVGNEDIESATYGSVTLSVSEECRAKILNDERPWAK